MHALEDGDVRAAVAAGAHPVDESGGVAADVFPLVRAVGHDRVARTERGFGDLLPGRLVEARRTEIG